MYCGNCNNSAPEGTKYCGSCGALIGNEYLSYLEEDEKLHEIIKDIIHKTQRLNRYQTEKFIFYLKSRHSYYPKSTNDYSNYDTFTDKLKEISNSTEQIQLQKLSLRCQLKATVASSFGGVALASSIILFLSNQKLFGFALLAIAYTLIFLFNFNQLNKSTIISKEQDRRYFLSSIRKAKACNELCWAGLFAYTKNANSNNEDLINDDIKNLTTSLRNALYNDEYFEFSQVENKKQKTNPTL